jgi:hypothetical protein
MKKQQMTWKNKFKIAIIDGDVNTLEKLIDNIPKVDTVEEAKETLALIQEALSVVENATEKTLQIMNKIKKTKAFLKN